MRATGYQPAPPGASIFRHRPDHLLRGTERPRPGRWLRYSQRLGQFRPARTVHVPHQFRLHGFRQHGEPAGLGYRSIAANQSGNGTYAAAPAVTHGFNVTSATAGWRQQRCASAPLGDGCAGGRSAGSNESESRQAGITREMYGGGFRGSFPPCFSIASRPFSGEGVIPGMAAAPE